MPYKDKEKQKEFLQQHYLENKDKYRTSRKNSRRIINDLIKEIKSDLGCSKCSEKNWMCLDFHHRNPEEKLFRVSQGIRDYSKSKILEEIKKCDILCANCHIELHYHEIEHVFEEKTNKKLEWIQTYKEQIGCQKCGMTNFVVLVFRHMDYENNNPTRMAKRGFTMDKIVKEIEKCEVLCMNCYRIEYCSNMRNK